MVTIVTMKVKTMTELLRTELEKAGSLYPIEAATGVKRMSMWRFLKDGSLRLDTADKLAAYFGIESRKKKGR